MGHIKHNKAIRSARFFWLIACACAFGFALVPGAGYVAAAESLVTVRSGEHKTYSRLVFDWPSAFDYDTKKEAESLNVNFTKSAQLDGSKILITGSSNITSLAALSNAPLRVKIGLPKDSKFRVLKTPKKLIVDVFNPPSGKAKRTVVGIQDMTPRPEVASLKQEEDQEQQDGDTATGLTPNDMRDTPGSSRAGAENISQSEDQAPAFVDWSQFNTLASPAAPTTGDSLISISSTGALALGVFELRDSLVIVTDRNDIVIKPQIGGADAQAVRPFLALESQKIQAFRGARLDGAHYEGKGGGLLWRLSVSNTPKDVPKSRPVRKGAIEGQARGGSIFFPLGEINSVQDFTDPLTGEPIKVVVVDGVTTMVDSAASFIEFDVLRSPLGMAIRPKVDDLEIRTSNEGVTITRPRGLSILPEDVVTASRSMEEDAISQAALDDPNFPQIYRFASWAKASSLNGKFDSAHMHKRKIATLSKVGGLSQGRRVEGVINLAREYLSHGYAAEAVGLVRYAENEMPELLQNPEFAALRGAARIMNNNDKDGFQDLLINDLNEFKDVDYWKAVAVSHLGDWQQAAEIMPKDFTPLQSYPPMVRKFLTFGLAEISLRAGDNVNSRRLLKILEGDLSIMNQTQSAAYDYLKGELYRQKGESEKTDKLWGDLAKGVDDFYRTRAGLALTRLHIEEGHLKAGEAIDRLERLRYSWRGDDLETQVNFWLGRTYFEAEKFIKGLKIMRSAAELASSVEERQAITSEMTDVFVDFYTSDKLDEVSPLDAVSVYEQFTELLPRDERGDAVIENLADHLVKANILTRAGDLLDLQVKMRLNEAEDNAHAVRVQLMLASIRLRDRKADEALNILRSAEDRIVMLPEEQQNFKDRAMQDLTIFRAKALSEKREFQRALELLERIERSPEVNKLRADIAWEAQYWDDAAYALNDVVLDENISLTRPLTGEQENLILNRAVALNLMDDRIGLANWREKYSVLMSQTNKARLFDVVTRPRQNARLADRDTLLGAVSEVDLFKDFLETYRGANEN